MNITNLLHRVSKILKNEIIYKISTVYLFVYGYTYVYVCVCV